MSLRSVVIVIFEIPKNLSPREVIATEVGIGGNPGTLQGVSSVT